MDAAAVSLPANRHCSKETEVLLKDVQGFFIWRMKLLLGADFHVSGPVLVSWPVAQQLRQEHSHQGSTIKNIIFFSNLDEFCVLGLIQNILIKH